MMTSSLPLFSVLTIQRSKCLFMAGLCRQAGSPTNKHKLGPDQVRKVNGNHQLPLELPSSTFIPFKLTHTQASSDRREGTINFILILYKKYVKATFKAGS